MLYEALGIVLVSVGLSAFTGQGMGQTGLLAAVSSLIAMAWNYAYNALFEAWEVRRSVKGRGLRRRLAHAAGFEAGLVALLVPLLAWWLGLGLLEALAYDLTLVVFFLAYTFVFNLAFDAVFGLPASAQA